MDKYTKTAGLNYLSENSYKGDGSPGMVMGIASDARGDTNTYEAKKPTTNSNHSTERDKKTYDPAHGHTKPEGGNPQVCSCITSSGPSTDCAKCQGTGEIITPKRKDKKVDEAEMNEMRRLSGLEEAGKPTTNSNHSTERDKKTYDPAHGHSKPEGGKPGVCKACSGAGCHRCDDGQVVTPKRNDKKVDEAENSPDGNAGADDDGDNDKYNQDASTVQDRKSIQEADDLLAIIKGIKV